MMIIQILKTYAVVKQGMTMFEDILACIYVYIHKSTYFPLHQAQKTRRKAHQQTLTFHPLISFKA